MIAGKTYKRKNLNKALDQLKQFCGTKNPGQLEMAGIIQAFEFTFEQFWKTIKWIAENQGYASNSPRSALKQGFKLGLLQDEKIWLKMLLDRNETAHVYNEELAKQIYDRIVKLYLNQFLWTSEKLSESLKELPNNTNGSL